MLLYKKLLLMTFGTTLVFTTVVNIQKFYVLPTEGIYVFYGSQEKKTNISVYSINLLLFTAETECVYCTV